MTVGAWLPELEDLLWLIEEVAADVAVSNHSTSHACWHPRERWEPILRQGLGLGEIVCDGDRQLAWSGDFDIAERWDDGYTIVRKSSYAGLRRLLKIKALTAARNRGHSKVAYSGNCLAGSRR